MQNKMTRIQWKFMHFIWSSAGRLGRPFSHISGIIISSSRRNILNFSVRKNIALCDRFPLKSYHVTYCSQTETNTTITSKEKIGKDKQDIKCKHALANESRKSAVIDFLIEKGFDKQDVISNKYILRESLQKLQNRWKELEENELHPTSVKDLSSAKKFKSAKIRLKRIKEVEKILGLNYKDMCFINIHWGRGHPCRASMPSTIKKIRYLLEKGYKSDDIITSGRIITLDLETIKKAFEDTRNLEITSVNQLYDYSKHKIVRNMQSQGKMHIHKLLGIRINVPSEKGVISPFMQSPVVIQKNFRFLQECAFESEHIKSCPLILCHSSDVLKEHWKLLPSREEVQPLNEWESDKVKLINVLQYYIERESNFKYPALWDCFIKG